jgi:hypothetical protein
MQAKKFISKVLPDGHLALPEDMAKEVGHVYEVILWPIESTYIYTYTQALAQEKGFSQLTEDDLEKLIHESRSVH